MNAGEGEGEGEMRPVLGEEHLGVPAGMEWVRHLLRWTRRAEDELARRDVAGNLGALFAPEGRRSLMLVLLRRLADAANPALESLVHERLRAQGPLLAIDVRLATGQQRSQAARAVLAAWEAGDPEGPQGRTPLLSEVLDHVTERFVEATLELVGRLARDWGAITHELFGGVDPGPIVGVGADGADVHFHGRTTCVLTAQAGRFLYRPHDCGLDALFEQVVARWFSDTLAAPHVVARPGYGWCGFVEGAPVASEGEVTAYFRRLGRAFALLQALGASDMHAQNWVACGAYPALVDLETILTPTPRVFGDPTVRPDATSPTTGLLFDLNHSLMPSALLPCRRGDRQLSVLLDDHPESRCLPVLDGHPRTVLGHEEAFLAGFSEGYDRCVGAREELRAVVTACRGVPVRRLLRTTDYYVRLLRRLRAPGALASREAQATAQKALAAGLAGYFERHGAPHLTSLARWELACLLDGDIPYFCAASGGHDLCGFGCTPADVVVPDYFERSAVEAACERIDRLGAAERDFELSILRESLRMAIVEIKGAEAPTAVPASEVSASAPAVVGESCRETAPLGPDEARAAAEEIFDEIAGRMLISPSGGRGWLMRHGEAETISLARPELAQGTAGLGIFFGALAWAGSGAAVRTRAREMAQVCLDDIERALEDAGRLRAITEDAVPLGLASGLGGVLVALAHLERCLGDGRARGVARGFAGLLGRIDIEQARRCDAFSGLAGLALGLAADSALADEPEVRRAARRVAIRLAELRDLPWSPGSALAVSGGGEGEDDGATLLLWDTLGLGRPVGGAGHGMAGVAAGLLAAARLAGDASLAGPARDALAFEHRTYAERLGTWPDFRLSALPDAAMHGICSGAPGMGLALLRCRDELAELGVGAAGAGTLAPAGAPTGAPAPTGVPPLAKASAVPLDAVALDEDIVRAVDACLAPRPNPRDHLCCGTAAPVELLLEVVRRGGALAGSPMPGMPAAAAPVPDPDLAARCHARAAELLAAGRARGWRLLPPAYRDVPDTSLLYGLAGIGYELLRLGEQNLPPVLF